jgi:guanylate kinase
MVSAHTTARLRQLLDAQPAYHPHVAITQQLQHITVIGFVGASCMGKTTVMQALVARDPTMYGEFVTFTSRSPRPGDNTDRYHYYAHTDEGLRDLLGKIERREVVQYNVNPFSMYVYGSDVTGYSHPINVGDIFASSINDFRGAGFGRIQVFSVITNPNTWLTRFNSRFPVDSPERQARLQEAVASLRWSLSQGSPDHSWVINDSNPQAIAKTVDDCIKRALSDPATQTAAHRLAKDCLTQIQAMLESYKSQPF